MTQTLVRRYHPARRPVPRTADRFATPGWDRLFDDLWSGFGLAPVAAAPRRFAPVFEATELEDAYRVTAELPGVDAADRRWRRRR